MRDKRNKPEETGGGRLTVHKEGNVLNDMSVVYQVLGTTEDFKRLLPVEMKVSRPRFCHFSQNLTLGRCPPKLCSPQFSMMPQHPHSTCLQGRTDPAKAGAHRGKPIPGERSPRVSTALHQVSPWVHSFLLLPHHLPHC